MFSCIKWNWRVLCVYPYINTVFSTTIRVIRLWKCCISRPLTLFSAKETQRAKNAIFTAPNLWDSLHFYQPRIFDTLWDFENDCLVFPVHFCEFVVYSDACMCAVYILFIANMPTTFLIFLMEKLKLFASVDSSGYSRCKNNAFFKCER